MAIAVRDFAEGTALPAAERAQIASAIWQLDADLRVEGIEALVTHDLHWLADIFRGWCARLPATANPEYWPLDSTRKATLAVLLRLDGAVIGVSAMRLIWLDGTLRRAMENGAFFFGAAKPPTGWRASCDIAQAEDIGDCPVIYNCAFRMAGQDEDAPMKRSQEKTAWRVLRLAQALALAHWRFSWMVARGGEAMALRYSPAASGMTSFARGLHVWPPGATEPERWQHLMFARRADLRRMVTEDMRYRTAQGLEAPLPLLDAGRVTA